MSGKVLSRVGPPEAAPPPTYADDKVTVQRQRISNFVADGVGNGEFSFTALYMLGEPFQSQALAHLEEEGAPSKPVLLVHVDPQGQISALRKRPAPFRPEQGTETYWDRSFGNFAYVSDDAPERLARTMILREGWSPRKVDTPRIVEWRWLRHAALTVGDAAGAGIVAKYEEILTRPGFREFAGEGAL